MDTYTNEKLSSRLLSQQKKLKRIADWAHG
jgi:hypothetical protein